MCWSSTIEMHYRDTCAGVTVVHLMSGQRIVGGRDGDLSQALQLTEESDADLLTMMSWRSEDECGARKAWGEFYCRHFKFLSFVCLRAYEKGIGRAGVEDLVNDTFVRVYLHAATTFQTDQTDIAIVRRIVRAWLRSISHNLFLMSRRAQSVVCETVCGELELLPVNSVLPLSSEREVLCQQIREVIDELTERERDVLFARFWNYDPGSGKQTFASEMLSDLIDRWQTTEENIRQILSRTLKKIKDRLS